MKKKTTNREYIMRAMGELNEREAKMLSLRLGLDDGKSKSIIQLASIFDVSIEELRTELRRIEKIVVDKIREMK